MSEKIVLATQNQDKVKEIYALLHDLDLEILTLEEFPEAPDVIEDGETLEDNALKKAREIAEYTKMSAVADDTGLEVDYLDGRPGVFSSRYAGENASYADNVKKLLTELKEVPWEKRGAQFRCAVALYNFANRETRIVAGVCRGIIAEAPSGHQGFGYDPVFYVPEYHQTYAEMDLELKNKISHRARAFLQLRNLLERDYFKIEK